MKGGHLLSQVGGHLTQHVMLQVIFQVMYKLMYKLCPLIKLHIVLTY